MTNVISPCTGIIILLAYLLQRDFIQCSFGTLLTKFQNYYEYNISVTCIK